MVTILMMSAKMATPGLLKTKLFWNKVYGVIIFACEVINKILSCDSNYIADVVTWPQFYKDLTRKNTFLRGGLGSSSIIWDLHWVGPWNFIPMWLKG